jgi:hypothetical protein
LIAKRFALLVLFFLPILAFGQVFGQATDIEVPSQTHQQQVDPSTSGSWPEVRWPDTWNADSNQPGYPVLEQARHFNVHVATIATGSYNHHPQITRVGDRFVAVWSNHLTGEDGPGQRVIGAMSMDGENWKSIGTVFDSPDQFRKSYENGRFLTAAPFVDIKDRTFAISIFTESVGYGKLDTPITGDPPSKTKTDEFGKLILKPHGYLIREVKPSGKLGPVFWFGDNKPEPIDGFKLFRTFEQTPESNVTREAAFALFQQLTDPLKLCPWDFNRSETEVVASDGSFLCEPATLLTPNQTAVRYLRDLHGSKRMYVQFSRNFGSTWSTATQTVIPDAPSKTSIGKLSDGTRFLIGNQVFSDRMYQRDPITIALSKDGTTFKQAHSIRWKTPRFKVPTQQKKSDGRGWGFQYPDHVLHEDFLWVIYSVNKECIDVSRIPIDDISLFQNN